MTASIPKADNTTIVIMTEETALLYKYDDAQVASELFKNHVNLVEKSVIWKEIANQMKSVSNTE